MNQFLCPHCKSFLNVCDYIVTTCEKHDGSRGLILLHPEIGNFEINLHEEFKVEEGERVRFYCPVCHKDLTSPACSDLVHMQMTGYRNTIYDVYFSAIQGERSTYLIRENKTDVFGDDEEKYRKFFI